MEKKFFERLADYNGFGFCYEEAAIAMMTLKDYGTAELHQGTIYSYDKESRIDHSWVTVIIDQNRYVFDFRLSTEAIPQEHYEAKLYPEIKFICTYNDFWALPEVNALYSRMQNPETSHFFTEFKFFRPDLCEATVWGFQGHFPTHKINDDDFGKTLEVSRKLIGEDMYNIYVSQQIVDEFMDNPGIIVPSKEARDAAFQLHLDPSERELFGKLFKHGLINFLSPLSDQTSS